MNEYGSEDDINTIKTILLATKDFKEDFYIKEP